VVTEYAWGSSTCDPCPTSPLSDADTATLGGDVLGLVATSTSSASRVPDPKITGAGTMDPGILRRYLRRIAPRMAACGAGPQPLVVEFDIEANGSTSKVKVSGATGAAQSCVAKAVDDMELPKPKGGGVAHVRAPVVALGFGGGGGGLILTRLHARYGIDTIGEDLVFREAAPIVGGRGVPDPSGKLPEGEQPAGVPQFQARYVMLHPWTGPIGCAQPQRGIWGPPTGKEAPPVRPALDLATAKRGAVDLTAMIAEAAQAAPAPAADAIGTPREPAPAVKPKRPRRGDGCAAGGGGGGGVLTLLAIALLLARRECRRAPRRSPCDDY
jgi:MYXO-CTERM domain-containing protein